MTPRYLSCSCCKMTFKSPFLLEKHREKFCIGTEIGRGLMTKTPEDMLEQLTDYKRRRADQRKQREMEERDILEEMDENERRLTYDNFISDEQATFDQDGPSPREQWFREHKNQLQNLAQDHGKHVTDLLSRNKELEEQRADIVKKLNELSEKSKVSSQVEKMLAELKAQEYKNELLLESMKQQLEVLQLETMRNKVASRHNTSHSHLSKRKEKVQQLQTFLPFYGGGSLSSEISTLRLSYLQNGGNDQLILIQLHDLLAEALQLEQRVKHPRTHRKERNHREQHSTFKRNLDSELISLEVENQRLEDEILQLQLKGQRSRTSQKLLKTSIGQKLMLSIDGDENDQRQLTRKDSNQKMRALKTEIDILKQEMEIQRLQRRMRTSKTRDLPNVTARTPPFLPMEDPRPQTPTLAKHFLDSSEGLGPAPYDPVAGFVVFYDFLLGLDPRYRVCRLVVGLYHGGQEMGDPSPLPAVYCDIDNLPAYFPEINRGNRAILAIKQVVPRVRPSPGISLIMELQASGGYDPYGQDINRLVSRGWIKIDIFDSQNRVISGRWKVPVRILPVKPSMTTGELNGVPQLENMELYLRLVNARDANIQTTAAIDTNNARLYKYPPLASARTTIPIDAPLSSFRSSYRYPTTQLAFPSFEETVDPPPPSADVMLLQHSASARIQSG
ncbi:coiled-coil domain-containing protein 17-like isoform X1 [Scyliorhinus canicula]|uniref:coiled-coil domain-containing protein 17-like isoform X1 n=1 Tax=Scyliorhinus canicula TaxID=7830 RepID=UPI0018F70B18|nr:coiled-coil domain-containing protein 17-like isoform X1 [Scyliorhinus canicula]